MRLELGTFPVTDDRVRRDDALRRAAGSTVDRGAVAGGGAARIRASRRAELEIARPGESVRIWPVRDVIEPRIKVEGPGVCYPGICGRDDHHGGRGAHASPRRHGRRRGLERQLARRGRGLRRDLSRHVRAPTATMYPTASSSTSVSSSSPIPALGEEIKNYAVHKARADGGRPARARPCAASTRPSAKSSSCAPVDPALPQRGLHLVRAFAPGHVGLADRVLHGDLWPDPAHAALVSASERDPGRRAHAGPIAPPSPCRGRWPTIRSSSTSTAATAGTGTSSA